MQTFNNIELTFNYQGHNITGVLNGDIGYWEFKSKDAVFLARIKTGVLTPRISFKIEELDLDEFISCFYKAADTLLIVI
jgi:hypothetical protein